MRKLLLSLTIVGLFGLSFVPSARADSVTYDLSAGNTAISSYPAPYGTVTVTLNSSSSATVVFTAGSQGIYTYYFAAGGGTTLTGVNVSATNSSISTPTYSPSTLPAISTAGSGSADGFGSFNQTTNNTAASDHYTSITFTITATGAGWTSASQVLTENTDGYSVAAHILVYNDNTNSTVTTGWAGGESPVPEPASLLLLGSGLLGLGSVGLWRKKGTHKEE